MFRRLAAVFALHFFLSVSAFAFGGMAAVPLAQGQSAPISQAAPEGPQTPANPDAVMAESWGGHGLADEVVDLPDSLPRSLVAQRPPVDGVPRIGYRQPTVLPLSPDGLLRPPRQSAPAA